MRSPLLLVVILGSACAPTAVPDDPAHPASTRAAAGQAPRAQASFTDAPRGPDLPPAASPPAGAGHEHHGHGQPGHQGHGAPAATPGRKSGPTGPSGRGR